MKLTHRRHSAEINTQHVMLFCNSDRNDGYGSHVWTLKTDLPEVSDEIIAHAAGFFGIEIDEARELCNPENIVETAGAWDDARFVSEVYHLCGEPIGFRTPDGAVVLDRDAVEITYAEEVEA